MGKGTFRYIILLLVLATAGCAMSRYQTKADRSFVDDEPCKAPCWNNINLQKSDGNDVLRVLENLPFVIQSSVGEWESNDGWLDETDIREIHYKCSYHTDGVCGLFVLANDQVVLTTHWIAYKLTLNDMVKKLGIPEYWNCVENVGWGQGGSLYLFWPNMGISAKSNVRTCLPRTENLKQNIQVDYITYADSRYFIGKDDPENWPRWEGFDQ